MAYFGFALEGHVWLGDGALVARIETVRVKLFSDCVSLSLQGLTARPFDFHSPTIRTLLNVCCASFLFAIQQTTLTT